MQRLAFFVLFLAAATMTAAASPKGDFEALLDEHWAVANREQVFFRTDPDAWRMHGARALGLAVPERPRGAALPEPALRALLVDLARSGMVLPGVEEFGRGRG